ncbi:GNAT family N-acetyltransferase [Nonomuraea cavernae]|uniref:N-acetyltransferase domain-containing protein n=1 Tax=Nonomuraea cavernae TaxID=2045107 RepID=A0A917YQS6_9ACTN|nr:GNAT family N-acetyltransferase [Nonomuraea cavernae]MCA2184444.1 GNAT family N-acetyltransferase [Nonomuraea cavernae]GGO63780.1 hypothetical protein GCM10012289_11640 [Nonomuraea cavernae]
MESIRRPRTEDAPAIHDLVAATDLDVLGTVDTPIEDIADQLADPALDLDRDAWLSHDDDGRLIAWAWACRNGDSDLVDVDVLVRPGADPSGDLTGELWRTVLDRAGELARERGHAGATVDIGLYRADEVRRAVAREHGFEPGTSYHRLRIDHDGPLDPPAPPPGLTLHTGETDDVRREAHRIHQEGFAEHFGFVPIGYDQWHERKQAQSATDWSQLTVARIDGRPAALVIGNNQFVPDEGCGYVDTLAVLPAFRGRSLGRFLLLHAFAADAARGRKGTILHVDSNNTTPALGLYLSAGMRLVMVIDIWRRRV